MDALQDFRVFDLKICAGTTRRADVSVEEMAMLGFMWGDKTRKCS